jgi:cbb3-type cytochrome oxidase subunit 3
MDGPIEWFGAAGAIIAAALIAADLGRRTTGWAMVLFVLTSLTWVLSGLLHHTMPLVAQNLLLLVINLWGVWQYLLSPRKKREMDRQQELADQACAELDREEGKTA